MSEIKPRTIHVVGSGGREYAIVRRLLDEDPGLRITAAPGSSSWLPLGVDVWPGVSVSDFQGQLELAEQADLTIIGPEQPLMDHYFTLRLRNKGCIVFGPDFDAAMLEGSKAFCAGFLRKINIPAPAFEVFTVPEICLEWLSARDPSTLVIKADGLAAGKGVFLPDTEAEAASIINDLMIKHTLGDAGKVVVIQERIFGPECSVMVITDGKTVQCCRPVRDHKRLSDGDRGPNTGGMGVIGPLDIDMEKIQLMAEAIVHGMEEWGCPFVGCLFLGLMQTVDNGLQVLEINCRFGDPEAIALMALLTPKTSLLSVIDAAATGDLLGAPPLVWLPDKVVTVVLASAGYPASSTRGKPISGIDQAIAAGAIVTHMGTSYDPESGVYCTAGGRVLAVTGLGSTFARARDIAYAGVGQISFEGMQYRTDIGESIAARDLRNV